jgi:hypothetical protein
MTVPAGAPSAGTSGALGISELPRAVPARFLFNAMLIRVQRPGALAVASRRRWQDYGRTVAPDAVPIVILQPFGPVQFVYDVGDTHRLPFRKARSGVIVPGSLKL